MRHRRLGGINFAPIPKQRIINGHLTSDAVAAFEERRDIVELICPVCSKYLIDKDDVFHCYYCGLAGEVILVVDRLVADDDPHRLSIRLLQQEDTLTLKAYKHAKENEGFIFGSLPCPSCDEPITQLLEHDSCVQPSCCQVVFPPQIVEIRHPKPPRNSIQRWKVSYELVEKIGLPHPTSCKLTHIDLATYESELARFAPKIETLAIEADPVPSETQKALPPEDMPSSDDTEVSIPETIDVTHTDAITLFFRRCILRNAEAITPRNEVYQAYVQWIGEQHQAPLSNRIFYRHLREVFPYVRFGQNRINGKRMWCYRGISLRRDDDPLRG